MLKIHLNLFYRAISQAAGKQVILTDDETNNAQ